MLSWKSSHVCCQKVDLLHAYCCLRQVHASISHGYGFQDEVRAFLKSQRACYTVPLFSGEDYMEDTDCSGADCVDAFLAIRCMKSGRYRYYALAHWLNRFRSETFRVDVILVRYIQCCFRRIAFYLDSEGSEIEPASRLVNDLSMAMGNIGDCLGRKRIQKAWRVENYNQPDFLWHYTFEELLADPR